MSQERVEYNVEPLAALFAADEDVELAMIFGSAVDRGLRADSDVDVAVLTRSPLTAERKGAIIRVVAELTGRPVDLVDLRSAGVAVTSQILRHGRRLFERRPSVFPALLSRTLADVVDFLPYRERILRERRRAWIR